MINICRGVRWGVTAALNCSNSPRSKAVGRVKYGGHHTSLFTILPAIAELLRLTAIQGQTCMKCVFNLNGRECVYKGWVRREEGVYIIIVYFMGGGGGGGGGGSGIGAEFGRVVGRVGVGWGWGGGWGLAVRGG